MSHFTVLVVGENPEEQLAPFSEELPTAPYNRPCWCVGMKAKNQARAQVDKIYKSIEELRKEFHVRPPEDKSEKAWRKFIKKYETLEKKYTKEHPLYDKPDPTCEECKGSGIVVSTYNPNSKWDWYSVGGRWCGFFKLKEGKKGDVGRPGVFDNKPMYDADQARKGEIDWKGMEESNRKRAKEGWNTFKEELKNAKTKEEKSGIYFKYDVDPTTKEKDFIKERMLYTTFAVLIDGNWYEKGQMGWWGIVTNGKKEDKWNKEWKKLVGKLPDNTLLTLVDCHI